MEAQELFGLLDEVRRRPAMMGTEAKSLTALRVFLSGFEYGVARFEKRGIFGYLRPFNSWVAKELGFAESTSGWCNMILARAESEQKAAGCMIRMRSAPNPEGCIAAERAGSGCGKQN